MIDQDLIGRIQQRAHNLEQATDMAETSPRVANPPIPLERLAMAEAEFGFSLPEFMRQLYLQVGNGGFGPGYGLFPLGESSADYEMIETYARMVSTNIPPPDRPWPKEFVLIADWGCGIYSSLNWQKGSVHRFNGDLHEDGQPWESVFASEAPSLEAWFEDWFARPGRERFSAFR